MLNSLPVAPRRQRLLARIALAAAVITCAMAWSTAPSAHAAIVNADRGTTNIRLAQSFRSELEASGLHLSVAPPACQQTCYLRFPMTNGRINPANGRGMYHHSGGFTIRSNGHRVSFSNLRIHVTAGRSTVSARINGSRQWRIIFAADLSDATISRPGVGTTVRGVRLSLNRSAALLLRRAFGDRAFHVGMPIGTATIAMVPREASITGGATELAIPTATVAALTGAGITPSAAGPATTTPAGAFSFPITSGRVVVSSLAGAINHSGGITLTQGGTVVTLANFRIDTRLAQLWGSVNGAAPVALLDLDLATLDTDVRSQELRIGSVEAGLTAGAAAALNAAFTTAIFTEGLDFGTASVMATTA